MRRSSDKKTLYTDLVKTGARLRITEIEAQIEPLLKQRQTLRDLLRTISKAPAKSGKGKIPVRHIADRFRKQQAKNSGVKQSKPKRHHTQTKAARKAQAARSKAYWESPAGLKRKKATRNKK
ncbi:MAG: hypothetical protein ABI643_04260 [Candidatus Doudnabacteria bacterium]